MSSEAVMKFTKKKLALWIFMLGVVYIGAAAGISVKHLRTIKDDAVIFEEVRNMLTGPDGEIYILDSRKRSVYRFNAEGRYIGNFGKQGEGPGEFRQVVSMVMDEDARLLVAESWRFISLFDPSGIFIKRIDLEGDTGIPAASWQLVGAGLYLCVGQVGQDYRQQLVDAHGQVLPLPLFTLPDDTIRVNMDGTQMSYRIRIPDSTPNLIHCHAQKLNAMAFSKDYQVKLVDEKGALLATIKQDVQPQPFNPREKAETVELIKGMRIPPPVRDAAIEQMSKTKNIIENVFITDRFVWVVRVKDDLTKRSDPFPVDLYDRKGRFLRKVTLPQYPLWIDARFYFSLHRNDEDDVLIEQYSYELTGS
jgi:hypothetical protein